MNCKFRKVVVIVGSTALFGAAAGCGSSSTTNATTNATPASGGAQQQGAPGGGRMAPPPAPIRARASKLGVSTAKLQAAMQVARSTHPAGSGTAGAGPGGRLAAMTATIAK